MEAATAFWHSTEMFASEPHGKISRGLARGLEPAGAPGESEEMTRSNLGIGSNFCLPC
jgi:hypothetical protein